MFLCVNLCVSLCVGAVLVCVLVVCFFFTIRLIFCVLVIAGIRQKIPYFKPNKRIVLCVSKEKINDECSV